MSDLTVGARFADLTLTRLTPPPTLEDPADRDVRVFRALAEIGSAVCRRDTGHDDLAHTADEILPSWLDQSDIVLLGFVAERDGEIVGLVTLEVPQAAGADDVVIDLLVRPDLWGAGIEDALMDAAEADARALGRPVVQMYTLHRPTAGGDRLAPSTGWGDIPADDRQTRLMLARGYALEQVERNSTFDLTRPLHDVERMLEKAEDAAGPDYRLVSWSLPTPPEFVNGFAYAISRMSTDVPVGGMVWAEETWDAARVARRDARLTAAGMTVSVAAVLHEPTGVIAAYSEMAVAADRTAAAHQWGTLVLKEHRGHRLGTIVKCANLLRWREIVPECPRVSTFNAEENRPMLDVNEAVGFVPASYAGGWKKVVDVGGATPLTAAAASADSAGSSGSTGS